MRSPNRNVLHQNDSDSVKKGPWSAEEDERLSAYIKRYGIWNWTYMPKAAGLARTGKSCRLRWLNYLRPNIRHGSFTKEEEETIIKWQRLLGNRWSTIATKLPGRTDNDIKNHWNIRLKRRNLQSDGYIKKTMDETTTLQAMDSNSDEENPNLMINSTTSSIMATISIDNAPLKASTEETRKAPISYADSYRTSSSASLGITFQHNEENESSLDVDDELQCFWEELIPIEDLYSLTKSTYIESQDLILPSHKLQGFSYSSDLRGDFSIDLWEHSHL